MIAKAKAISHGHAHLDYIKGESRHKKHKDKIIHVTENRLPAHACAAAVWDSICDATRYHPRMKNNLIRIVVSPSPEHTRDFTQDDWRDLWLDFAKQFDGIELKDDNGKVYSPRSNILGSIYTVELHLESDSGVPHIHAAVCRVDGDDRTNSDHDIHVRAQRAAEIVARKRGWETAESVHESNVAQVRKDCIDSLRSMPKWDLETYLMRLADKGYDVQLTKDKKGVPHGYVVKRGKTCYKASAIDRKLTLSHIEETWKKLHDGKRAIAADKPVGRRSGGSVAKPVSRHQSTANTQSVWQRPTCFSKSPNTVPFSLQTKTGQESRFYIPEPVMDFFNSHFDDGDTANAADMIVKAVMLFVGVVDAATTIRQSSVGGGGGDQSPWDDRHKDEDDMRFAKRCAQFVSSHTPRQPKTKFRRR